MPGLMAEARVVNRSEENAWPEVLAQIDAPAELQLWVQTRDPQHALDICPRADWWVWLSAATGQSLARLVWVLAKSAQRMVPPSSAAYAPVEHALSVALECVRSGASVPCGEAAAEADLAASHMHASFRTSLEPGYNPLARAAAWVARASEGLAVAKHRSEARFLDDARRRASLVGVGFDVFSRAPTSPALDARLLHTPDQRDLLFVVAACAEAAEQLVQASAQRDRQSADDEHVRQTEMLRELLDTASDAL